MPNDPRLNFYFDEQDAHIVSVGADASITPLALSTLGYAVSPQLGMAVALVNTGTNAPQVGLGSAGNEFFGVLKQVDVDGTCSVQDRGMFLVAYNTGTAPTVGNPVGVDGAGKVELLAGNKQAFCMGFANDPKSGTLKCIVKKV